MSATSRYIGSSGGGDDDGYGSRGKKTEEYREHVLTLSSNTMTATELTAFVKDKVLATWQERRRQREKDKLYYFLFDSYDEEDSAPHYERYEWRSTKRPEHVISEHTETIMRRVTHFTTQPEWLRRPRQAPLADVAPARPARLRQDEHHQGGRQLLAPPHQGGSSPACQVAAGADGDSAQSPHRLQDGQAPGLHLCL